MGALVGLIEHPQRKAYQLGWVRVLLRLASTGPDDLKRALLEWSGRWQTAFLTGEKGAIPASRLAEVPALARDLDLLREGRITDAGHALLHVDSPLWETEGGDPFTFPLHIRWMLWWSIGTKNDEFWSAAFRSWREGQSSHEWLMHSAATLAQEGKPSLLGLLESMNPDKHHEMHGKPRFGQLGNLGWKAALPRLHDWAESAPREWSSQQVLEAFAVAEGLSIVEPEIDRLRRVLRGLPPTLRGLLGDEAPSEAVQVLAVAESLESHRVERWFGEPWDALVRKAEAFGVARKSGGDSLSPNLTWNAQALSDPWHSSALARPRPNTTADGPQGSPPGVALSQTAPENPRVLHPGPVPEPPDAPHGQVMCVEPLGTATDVMPERPPDGGEPGSPVGLSGLDSRNKRGASWLRAVAWWCRGPTPGDLLFRGHDSVHLVLNTLTKWLSPRERKRLNGRMTTLSVGSRRQVDVVSEVLRSFASVLGDPHLAWVAREIRSQQPIDHLLAALRRVSAVGASRGAAVASEWISAGTEEFSVVEAATSVWLSEIVDAGRVSKHDLQVAVLDIKDKPADGALALIERLRGVVTARSMWRFEGKFVSMGDPLTFSGPLTHRQVEFVVAHSDDSSVFRGQIISFSLLLEGSDVRSTALRAQREAATALMELAVGQQAVIRVAYSDVDPPDAYTDTDERVPVGIQQENSSDAGRARWLCGPWFPGPATPTPGDGWAQEERREFWRSSIESHPAHRLVALWFAVEHGVDGGDTGGPVVEELALAAASLVPHAFYHDVETVIRLIEHPDPLPRDWASVVQWSPKFDCAWAELRWSRLKALFDGKGEGTLQEVTYRAVANAAWLLQAVYGVRNRVAHEADWGGDGEERVLDRLHAAAIRLVKVLVDARVREPDLSWRDLAVVAGALVPPNQKNQEVRKGDRGETFDAATYITAWNGPPRAE